MAKFSWFVLVSGLLLCACGDDSDPAGPKSPVNLPPTVTGPESVGGIVGAPVMFDVVASDPDGDALELTVSAVVSVADWRLGIRAGDVSVNQDTGRVTFTPNKNDRPSRILVISAEDPSGEQASIDVLVQVANP